MQFLVGNNTHPLVGQAKGESKLVDDRSMGKSLYNAICSMIMQLFSIEDVIKEKAIHADLRGTAEFI